jgi:DivIVA domain-containing protein
MCSTVAEVRAHALALLLGGYSPEEVEEALDRATGEGACALERTALTDPNNVLMVEVTDNGTRSS